MSLLKSLLSLTHNTRRSISSSVLKNEREVYVELLGGVHKGVSVLRLNRPAVKNALGITFMKQFSECLDAIQESASSDETRVLLVQSNCEGVFCSGADLKERKSMSNIEADAFVASLRSNFTRLEQMTTPTIAVLDGAAIGGGLELALSCDIRISGPKTKLGLVETKWAIIPGAGGTQRLPRLIGASKSKELIFTGKILDSNQAEAYGIVNHAVSDPQAKSLEIASAILPKGPIAVRMAKHAIDKGIEVDQTTGFAIERLCYLQVIPTEDRQEGMKAFREKREPVFKGR